MYDGYCTRNDTQAQSMGQIARVLREIPDALNVWVCPGSVIEILCPDH